MGAQHQPPPPRARRRSQARAPRSQATLSPSPSPPPVSPPSVPPHSPLGKATRGRGSAQSMAAGTTTPQSRRRAAVGMAGGGRLAPLGGPGTVPVGRARVREPQEGCVRVSPPPLPQRGERKRAGAQSGEGLGGGPSASSCARPQMWARASPPATAAPTTAAPGPSHGKSSAWGCPDAPASSPGDPVLSRPSVLAPKIEEKALSRPPLPLLPIPRSSFCSSCWKHRGLSDASRAVQSPGPITGVPNE